MKLTRIGFCAAVIVGHAFGQTTCVSFPSGFIPFSSISYVTAADSLGDHLVVGVPAAGAISFILANIPAPAFTNQMFCDAQVQLAPGQFYPNVYVPTADEVAGIYTAFAGLLTIPGTSQPYPNGVIPATQLGSVFAWRIGPAQAGSANGGWSATGSMTEARDSHAAVLLPTGKVLIVSSRDTSADIYDPATGAFSATGQMQFNHGDYLTATLLNNGTVLIVGGVAQPSAAELYDPSSGQFTATGGTIQPHAAYSSATLLTDGRVLVVGGYTTGIAGAASGAEIFNPQAGTFASAGAMAVNRAWHTATLLTDGRVLIAGGEAGTNPTPTILGSAEVYDPSAGSFSLTLPMTMRTASHFAALLPNGKVLVGGGFAGTAACLFDPTGGTFTSTGSLNVSRSTAGANVLSDGEVLVDGGDMEGPGTNTAELYNPATGTFAVTGSMSTSRTRQTSTLLLDGRVLVTGGDPLCCGAALSSAELYTPVSEGLLTSQTGLTFRVAQGNSGLAVQQVQVLSPTATIPWTLSTHTYEGGNWLVVTPSSGNSAPGATPVTLTVAANPAGLAAQDYYGSVTLTPTDGIHAPVSIAVVLNIVPAGTAVAPVVTPGGLVFLGTSGAALNPQSFTISNLTSTPITFSGAGSTTPKWFGFTPSSGTINGGQSASITVTPNLTGLAPGVYPGSITLTFGDGSTQVVQLLLVLSSIAGAANSRATPAACTPSKLLPVFTTIGTGFSAPAAWATPLVVEVVDDCGNAFNTGSVIVSFTDGDSPINLLSTGDGDWAGTWVPVVTASGITVRADAQALPLTGSVQVTGAVSMNQGVPVVSAGGVVSSGDFSSAPALGLLVSIFGTGLADSAASAAPPLPDQLGTTSVLLSGGEQLPLLYAADNIINVQIPYDAAVNSTEQLVVQHGNAISVPVPIAIFTASPSILSANGTGSGQGHVYVIGSGGVETQANQNAPAAAGNPVVIYCVGLGAVSPGVSAGAIVPGSPLSMANAPVTVTFGTQTVLAAFAGLTPGLAGLYQVNATVPAGVTPGNQVPVTISVGGRSSSGSIYMAIQ